VSRLIFIDESGLNTKMARLRGRSPRGERCRAAVPHGHWKSTTFTAGLRLDGIVAPWLLEGAMDGEAFLVYGYAYMEGVTTPRTFAGTSSKVKKSDYSNSNYTKAINEHFEALCDNAKSANIIVMTVALDLDEKETVEKEQIEALKKCSSDSRYRKDPTDPGNAAKLFWNTTGGELEKTFKEIADELSNLRIIS
jgi:hypothetical protein